LARQIRSRADAGKQKGRLSAAPSAFLDFFWFRRAPAPAEQ